MAEELTITSGDNAAERLVKARYAKKVLAWRDILHEGPVPLTPDLAALSAIRAEFVEAKGWTAGHDLPKVFGARDATLARFADFCRVTLWFEHDLYDQLQLLQILDYFASLPSVTVPLLLVQSDTYLAGPDAPSIPSLAEKMVPVTPAQLALGRRAWSAVRQPTPVAWAELLKSDLSALPYLKPAVVRFLEELPAPMSGLSRTQHQILRLVRDGVRKPKRLFAAYSESETARFMGDWSFFAILDGLAGGKTPLVAGLNSAPYRPGKPAKDLYFDSELKLTATGSAVLDGKADHVPLNGVDHWLGGSHVTSQNVWRWSRDDQRLIPPAG